MSIQDQESFLSKTHPFEVLTPSQMAMCIEHMDIAYYPKDTVLIGPEKIPKYFFIIIKLYTSFSPLQASFRYILIASFQRNFMQ